MSAKSDDLGRIQEIFDVFTQTQRQIGELGAPLDEASAGAWADPWKPASTTACLP